MSYLNVIKKTIFHIWLIGAMTFAISSFALMISTALGFFNNIILFLITFGGFFFATMIFLWKLSETDGYKFGLAGNFSKIKYLTGVGLGIVINLAFTLLISFIPYFNLFPIMMNYYFIFPFQFIREHLDLTEVLAVHTSLIIDAPILLAVIFFGGCSGDRYATLVRESTEIETDSFELLEQESTTTPRKPQSSWRDSIK